MDAWKYLTPFFLSFGISVAIIMAMLFIFDKLRKEKGQTWWRMRENNLKRLGGVSIIIPFLTALIADKNLVISFVLGGIILALGAVLVFGVVDDWRRLGWKTQLFFQVTLAVFFFILGVRIDHVANPLNGGVLRMESHIIISFFAVLVWFILIVNSMNWLDGMDGLSGGVTLIGSLTLFFLALKPEVNQPPTGIITMALAGSVLGFMIFNFHPAKIFAGTSGSMAMGFSLAFISIFAGGKIATALLVLAIPVLDSFWVIAGRIRHGKSVFQRDKSHIHYKLMDLGWSQKKISLLFYAVTAVVAIVALNTQASGKAIAIIVITTFMATLLVFLNKKIRNSNA